jgi:hypothetical protein
MSYIADKLTILPCEYMRTELLHNVPKNTVTSEAVHEALQMAERLAWLCNDCQNVAGVPRNR